MDYLYKGELVVTFDKKMKIGDLSTRKINVAKKGDTSQKVITLSAVAVNAENNTFVFDAQASDLPNSKMNFNLNTEYVIKSFINMKSESGHALQYDLADHKSFKTDSEEYDITTDSIEVDSIKQVGDNRIQIEFDGQVWLPLAVMDGATVSSSDKEYEFVIDKKYDGKNKIELELVSGIFSPGKETLKFDFSKYLFDVLGRFVYMGSDGFAEVIVENEVAVDKNKPQVTKVDYMNKGELVVFFDRSMRIDDLSNRKITIAKKR